MKKLTRGLVALVFGLTLVAGVVGSAAAADAPPQPQQDNVKFTNWHEMVQPQQNNPHPPAYALDRRDF